MGSSEKVSGASMRVYVSCRFVYQADGFIFTLRMEHVVTDPCDDIKVKALCILASFFTGLPVILDTIYSQINNKKPCYCVVGFTTCIRINRLTR